MSLAGALRATRRSVSLAVVLAAAGCGTGTATPTPATTAVPTTTAAVPTTTTAVPTTTTTTTPVATTARRAPIVYRPAWLSHARQVPLLVVLHGNGNNGAGMQGITQFDQLANRDGFVVVYPTSADVAHSWAPQNGDLAYVHGLINGLRSSQNIDPTRIYATGFSAGGYEAWALGCNYPNQIAGIAIVANNMNRQLFNSCALTRPLSQYLLVGSADSIRLPGTAKLPSAAATTTRWRQLDNCANTVGPDLRRANVNERFWTSCADHTWVALTVVSGGLHYWPGAPNLQATDPASAGYDASAAVWAFLSPHRLAPSVPDVSLRSVKVSQKRSSRTVTVNLAPNELLGVTATLSGHGRPVVKNTRLRRGSRAGLRLPLRSSAPGGRYTVSLTIVDDYGRRATIKRSIRAPNLPKPTG